MILGDFIFVRAIRPINAGEEILISYVDPFLPYKIRSNQISPWQFVCQCDRCTTESKPSALELDSEIKRNMLLGIEIHKQASYGNYNYTDKLTIQSTMANLKKCIEMCTIENDIQPVFFELYCVVAGLAEIIDVEQSLMYWRKAILCAYKLPCINVLPAFVKYTVVCADAYGRSIEAKQAIEDLRKMHKILFGSEELLKSLTPNLQHVL